VTTVLDRTPARGIALGATLVTIAVLALSLHRHGHSQGDDFALYLRQAKSLFEGTTRDVVADNRFSVRSSGGAFSPEVYPWGAPVLLAPFVKLWGLDYDRLKLIEVACFCGWLVLVHGVVRRRLGRPLAWAIVVVVGTAPVLLQHTDAILSEYPHALAVAGFIWWLDRVQLRGALIDAGARDLVVLGLLAALAYNVRRESIVLIAAIGLVQVAELVPRLRDRWRRRDDAGALPWLRIPIPHVSFVVAVAVFQLLLPSMLFPDNADSGPKHIPDRLAELPALLTQMLGLEEQHALGMVVVALALVGVVAGLVTRPRLDGALCLVALLSLLAVSTHFRGTGPRYYFQILPWVLLFAATGVLALVQVGAMIVARGRTSGARRVGAALAIVALLVIAAVHVRPLSTRVAAVREVNARGLQQVGPTHPDYVSIYGAVAEETPADAVITFFRARTMTQLTDRRAIQTTNIDRAERSSDYYAQQKGSSYSQPDISELEGLSRGYVIVWSDQRWILWDLHPDD